MGNFSVITSTHMCFELLNLLTCSIIIRFNPPARQAKAISVSVVFALVGSPAFVQ